MDITTLKTKLVAVLERFPEIQAAYLFGSVAEGRASAGSDLDLALVPNDASAHDRRLDILAALGAVGLDRVDLVFLDVDDLVLRFEAVRPNVLIFARGDFDHGDYFSRTLREYFDFESILAVQREAYKRRLVRGQD